MTPDRILQLIFGYWATGIVGTAARHSLFTHIEAGVRTPGELATRAGISLRGTQALLDGLVGLDLVEVRDGAYHNGAEASAYLVDGRPTSLSAFAALKLGHVGSIAGLPDAVLAGGPATVPTVEVADNPHWENLVQAIAAQSVPVAAIAAEILRLPEAGDISILDVGGGSGVYSGVWLDLNPRARAVQLDWAPINAIARRLLAERGFGDRFECIDGDLHTADFGTGRFDIAVYSHIAHQEGPEDNMAIFARLRSALRPGGTLVVNDYVVDDDRGGPPFALTFAGEMLLKSRQGGTWRRSDYQEWLAKAGFDEVTFHPTPSPATVIIAR
ncbi:class I SAM-dependent methyltransferase [Actinoplanes sp. LDG1-06]|uniref:Class I SAM-dependent methyltransferase n=1 Tax=Paractinoplanes ovalisporus TaxID=2810368 RepID=A0ABS2AUV8_9ACTN|nr:class I SAM-dependent methyltransferase [Actinoplanes ovalisporus]MBM2623655.1 class I SAM-dependent methyltransferase [Actinoplanes ovalisporus]